jgi:hypothetical protein
MRACPDNVTLLIKKLLMSTQSMNHKEKPDL